MNLNEDTTMIEVINIFLALSALIIALDYAEDRHHA